ncbi:hypothetical protein PRK78_005865 [Emydomyces testavorans]|uniref:Tricarboxylate transport protein n=1 Tax=Emydomyces testavorans TaxID=2070801 RepID=A0AAF0DP86_9EURO|nr:hypothetical protein PRK78_005865 [Emydomyces testavorans]
MPSSENEQKAKVKITLTIRIASPSFAKTYHISCGVRKNTKSVKSSITGWAKAALAPIWQGMHQRKYLENMQLILKRCTGFVAFDTFKSLLQDKDGKISGPRTVLAGFGAGITESLLAVTPFESIKTQLIDDRKSGNPRMRGFLHGTTVIFRERGIRGFFQGFVPTTARQAANSATRFGSYTTLRQFAQGYVAPGEKLGTLSTFAIGGTAGLITVMQSIEAKKNYKNSFACAATIFKEEGFFTFWSGAVPRLARLILSGGIVFTMYEKTMEGLDALDPERKYI